MQSITQPKKREICTEIIKSENEIYFLSNGGDYGKEEQKQSRC